MVCEVAENAIEEALAGDASQVLVTLNPDGSCTVSIMAVAFRQA